MTKLPLLDAAESGRTVSKADFDRLEPTLRVNLINAQYDLTEADFSVFILLMGDDRIGTSQVADRLNEWMDARYIDTRVFLHLSDEERERPRFWRYWREMPANGRIGLFGGAWALNAISDRLTGYLDKAGFKRRLDHIRRLEQALVDDGTVVLKFWMHLPLGEHRKRVRKAKKNPDKAPLLFESIDEDFYKEYDDYMPYVKQLLEETDTESAPWIVVESTDRRHRDVTVGRTVLDAIQERLSGRGKAPASSPPGPPRSVDAFAKVDLGATLEPDTYKRKLRSAQSRLAKLSRRAEEAGLSTVLVFEGWDAAGKGGAIRRITGAIPARNYRVIPIAAPTEEERAHHYLWRFWRHIPRAGNVVIFDRSWYGRVLVERVEKFASEAAWQRAYAEIRDFEAQLTNHGLVVQKFWLHIDPEEQLRRFKAREVTPYKKHKITDEDYRNREKWDEYVAAINDMVAETSTPDAPWHIVPANDKRHARVQVVSTVCRALDAALKKR